MKKSILLILLLSNICCNNTDNVEDKSQTPLNKKEKIIFGNTIDKIDYLYIPESAMADSIAGIIINYKIRENKNAKRIPVFLTWNSSCTDGYYTLTVTPEQIYFSSSHDNPNPNLLFWVINIDSLQYNLIRTGISRNPPKTFKQSDNDKLSYWDSTFKDTFHYSPDGEWTKEKLKDFDSYCAFEIQSQLKKYMNILNSYINGRSGKVKLPQESFLINKFKFFCSSKEEMLEWLSRIK